MPNPLLHASRSLVPAVILVAALTSCSDPSDVGPDASDASSETAPLGADATPSSDPAPSESPSASASPPRATPAKPSSEALNPDLAAAGLTRRDLVKLRTYVADIGYYEYTSAYLGEDSTVPSWEDLQDAGTLYVLNCEAVAEGRISWEDQIALDSEEVGVPRNVAELHWHYVRDELCPKLS